jgi:hypothetical protein
MGVLMTKSTNKNQQITNNQQQQQQTKSKGRPREETASI